MTQLLSYCSAPRLLRCFKRRMQSQCGTLALKRFLSAVEHRAFFRLRQCLWCADVHEATHRGTNTLTLSFPPLRLMASTIFFLFNT